MKAKSWLLSLVGLFVLVGVGLLAYQMFIERQVEQRIAEEVSKLPSGVTVEYGEVDAGFLGEPLRINDIRLLMEGDAPVHIKQVEVIEYDRRNDPPNFLHAKASGIRRDLLVEDDPQMAALRKLGYQQIRGSYEIKYRYQPETRQFDLQELRGELEGVGAASLRMKLDNFELQRADAATVNQLPEFELRELTLTYSDDSLVRKLIAEQAKTQGVSEAELMAAIEQQIDAQARTLEDPFFSQLAAELKAFIREPGTLTLTAAPPQAVPVMEIIASALIRAAELPKMLNISVKAGD